MSHCTANVQFDTDFKVPHDSLREGRVRCKVLRSDCEILEIWDCKVTFRIRLLLKITVRSGELESSFRHRLEFDDVAWLDTGCWITGCEVTAAGCSCVVRRGLVSCSGCLSVRFFLEKRCVPICPPKSCPLQVVILPIILPIVIPIPIPKLF